MNKNLTILGLDIGRKRVGVAISRSGVLVEPVGVWAATPQRLFLSQLIALIAAEQVARVVVGVPPGQQGEWTLAVMERLSRSLSIPLIAQPEDFSTQEAQAATGQTADHADAIAAVAILQRYLEDTAAKKIAA